MNSRWCATTAEPRLTTRTSWSDHPRGGVLRRMDDVPRAPSGKLRARSRQDEVVQRDRLGGGITWESSVRRAALAGKRCGSSCLRHHGRSAHTASSSTGQVHQGRRPLLGRRHRGHVLARSRTRAGGHYRVTLQEGSSSSTARTSSSLQGAHRVAGFYHVVVTRRIRGMQRTRARGRGF